jgi:hypothetical protein
MSALVRFVSFFRAFSVPEKDENNDSKEEEG